MNFPKKKALHLKSILTYFSILCVCGLLFSKNNTLNNFVSTFFAPNATISVDNNEVCQDELSTITFEGSGGAPPYNFTYTLNGAAPVTETSTGNIFNLQVNTSVSNSYEYVLTKVSDNNGEEQTITNQKVTVKVNAKPDVDFSFTNNNSCSGETIEFTSNTADTSLTYIWDFGDGNTSDLKNPTHIFESFGTANETFEVVLVATNTDGCSTKVTKEVLVKQKPPLRIFDNDGKDFSNCGNSTSSDSNYTVTVGLISSKNLVNSYDIDWGDGNQETNITFPISHDYTSLGVFKMVITAKGDNGCNTDLETEVKNISNPSGSIVNPGSTQNLCAPTEEIPFIISSWGENSLDTYYEVNYGDGTTLTLTQTTLVNSTYYNSSSPKDSQDYPIPHIFTESSCPNKYTVSLNVINACGTTPSLLPEISVLSKPNLDFSFENESCVNTSVTFTNISEYGDGTNCDDSGLFIWDFGDGSDTETTEDISTINHIYDTPGTYTVKLSVVSFCPTEPITKTICIEPEITPLFTVDNDEGCIPLNIKTTNTTDTTGLCSPPTFLWTVSYIAENCGTNSAWEFSNGDETSENPEFLFKSPGKYTLTQNITTNCGTKQAVKEIEVKKPATIILNPFDDVCGKITINPIAVVENCATDAVNYKWTFEGGLPATSTNLDPGNIVFSTPGLKKITLEVTNSCGITAESQEFEVFEKPTITNTNVTQEICSTQTTSEITLTADAATATFTWIAVGTPGISGFTTNGTSNTIPSQNLINSGNAPGTVIYTVTPILDGCEGETVDFTITVNPAPTFTAQPISSEICLNGNATTLEGNFTNGVGTPSYQWFTNTIDDTSSGTLITGETNSTYNPPTNTVGSTFYYVKITFSSGGCSEITSQTAEVNVVPQIIMNPVSTPQTICVGGNSQELEVSYDTNTGTGNPSYQWYSNTVNSNTGGTIINGATDTQFTPQTFNSVGTFYFYAEISLDGNGCNKGISDVFEINVLSDPIIDSQPIATQELCQGATSADLSITVSGGTTSAITYQWYQNSTNSTIGGTAIVGANATTFSPTTANVGTFYYYAIASQTESGCNVTSTVSQLTVNTAPTFTKQPTASEVCLDGNATTLEVDFTNGAGTPTYQWFSNTIDNNTTGTAIAGETNSTYNPPTNTVGSTFYYAKVTFSSGGCLEITSQTAEVKVVPQIFVNPITAPQTICVGGTPKELEVSYDPNTGTGNPSYQWFSNTVNSNTGGTIISGATDAQFTPQTFNSVGTFYFYAEISLDGNGCNKGISDVFEINTIPDPIIDSQPIVTQELCQNSPPNDLEVSVSGGTSSPYSYQWYSNTLNSTSGGKAIVGETSATYKPNTSVIGTFYFYVVVFQPESDCVVTSEISELIVNKAPIINLQPTGSDVCLDAIAEELKVEYTDGVGTPSYQWFSNTIDDTSSGTLITGETNSTYNPPTNTVGSTFYYVKITFSSGGCSEITSQTAEVNVVPQIIMNPVSTPQTICVGGNSQELEVSYDTNTGTGNPSYQWYSNTVNSNTGGTIINGATDTQFTPQTFNSVGTFYFYAEISLDGNGCNKGISDVFEINVLSDPIIDSQPIATQELCQGATSADLSITVSGGTTSAITYQWYQNSTNSTIGGTAIVGANATTFSPTTANVGTFYYYAIASQTESGCNVTSTVSQLTVNTAPTFTKQPTASEVCLDGNATTLEVDFTNGAGTPTYQWFSNTIDNNTTGTAIAGETNSTYNPPTNTVGSTFYYVKITFSSGGCSEITSQTARVIVNEIPIISSDAITIYSGQTFVYNPNTIAGNVVPNDTKYTWSNPTVLPTGNVIGASAESIPQTEISQTLENTSLTSPVKVTYTVMPATSSCTGNSFILEVTVNPSIIINETITTNSCFEANDGSILTNITGGIPFDTTPNYLISWSGPNGFSSSNENISNLEAGVYTINVEDSSGFSVTESFTVNQPNVLSISKNLEKNISCFEGNDGTIEVTISGGTTPYTYNWTTIDGSGILLNSKNQNTLTDGTYTLEIIDKNNCKTSTEFILTEPEGLKIETVTNQEILCFGDATGNIEISVSGGTKKEISPGNFDYEYNWSGPDGFNSNSKNVNSLIAGTYTVTVTDNLGCLTSKEIIVNESPKININFNKADVSCYGEKDGSIDVTISGGKEPYSISWSNFANGTSLKNLAADTYVATVTDGNNCVNSVAIIIEQPIFFIEPEVKPISCNGENDGAISLNLTGGIAPITVTWNDDPSAGIQRNNLSAGTYSVTITDSDAKQCPIEQTFTLTNPPEIAVSSTVVDAIDCDIVNSGSIDLEVAGGTIPYTFKWSNNETTEDIKNLAPGIYTVEITDKNNCLVQKEFTIFRQDSIKIEFTESTITDCDLKTVSKKIVPKVTGGFLPYTFSWSAGTISGNDDNIMTTNQSGSYVLTITDDKGCIEEKSILINLPEIGDVNFQYSAFALDKYDLLSIEDPIQFTNLSTGNFTNVRWDFGDGSPTSIEDSPIHTYDEIGEFTVVLTINFDAGCVLTFERTITITKGYSLINPTAFTPNGDGFNDYIRPVFNGFTTMEMSVFDSWGTLVYFEKGETIKGWDGTIKEKPAENGNYLMIVKGVTFYEKEITETKSVTLLK